MTTFSSVPPVPEPDDASADVTRFRAGELSHRRLLAKAAEIIADDTHPGHQRLLDIVECAIELDPPEGWEPQPELASLPVWGLHGYTRRRTRLIVVAP